MTPNEIESLIAWSPVREVSTRAGLQPIRDAEITTAAFWDAWKLNKDALKAAGITVSQFSGRWIATWWQRPRPVAPPTPVVRVEAVPVEKPAPMPVPAHVAGKLRDYQVEPVATLSAGINRFNCVLDASKMGVGKSFAALGTLKTLGLKPMVICRKAAFPSWRRYAAHFDIDPNEVIIGNLESIRNGKGPLGTWVRERRDSSREREVFRWNMPNGYGLVIDEVHGCAGIDSLNSQLLTAAAWQKLPMDMLSATAANSPLKMRAIGYALGLHRGHDFEQWLEAHGCQEGKYGMEFKCGMEPRELGWWNQAERVWVDDPKGLAELERRQHEVMARIHNSIFPVGKGVNIDSKNIPGFPENLIIPEALDFASATKEIASAYADLELEILALGRGKQMAKRAIVKKTHVKIEKFKTPLICDLAKEAMAEGYSVAIFFNYTESLMLAAGILKTSCLIYGEQTPAERAKNEDDFQSNRSRVILLNNQAGGESLSLHDLHGGHPRQGWIFPTFWAEVMRQCSGRLPRNGGKTPVVQRIPFAVGTIEEDAYRSSMLKLSRIDVFNGDALTDSDLNMGLDL